MSVHSKDRKTTWLSKLNRIGELAAKQPSTVFNNIGHVLDKAMLREVYDVLDGKKGTGIDKMTKEKYGENLEEHLENLLKSLRRGTYKPKPARVTEITNFTCAENAPPNYS